MLVTCTRRVMEQVRGAFNLPDGMLDRTMAAERADQIQWLQNQRSDQGRGVSELLARTAELIVPVDLSWRLNGKNRLTVSNNKSEPSIGNSPITLI